MNIHHLELFYYVARHGGVSAAARRIPYGIQQPAISAQIIQLEDSLGITLFTRRPFKLSKAGEELFRFIEPFFSGLDDVARRLRGGAEMSIRIGATETVQRNYLPRQLQAMRQRFPGLHFSLVRGHLDEIEGNLLAQEIDIGIAPLLGKRQEGVRAKTMLQVTMGLLVPAKSPLRSAEELWRRDRIDEPLISGTADDSVCRLFQAELQRRKVEWFASIELNSQDLIARYVVEGFGTGLILVEPGMGVPAGLRLLPLDGFPKIPYGLIWMQNLSPLQRAFLEEAQLLADHLALCPTPEKLQAAKSPRRPPGSKHL